MVRKFRGKKVSILIILLFIISVLIIPSVPAPGLLKTQIDVKMNYDAQAASDKVVPLQGETIIEIEISTQIQGVFANMYQKILLGRTSATVDLSVESTPDWATAMITPNVVSPQISSTWGTPEKAYVHISFSENAPAHLPVKIVIKMDAGVPGSLGLVEDVSKTAEISFTPAYLPIIDATPRKTFLEVSPGSIGEFVIDLENLGNAETEFRFWVEDVPDGWAATIPASTIISSAISGGNPKSTVTLTVQPPYEFGYHNTKEQITVAIQGQYYAHGTNLTTPIYQHQFVIQNRGFSTPGFEATFIMVAIVGMAIMLKKKTTHK